MSQLAKFRQRQQSWGRRALGMFVAVWLNLALQPCAMAFDSAEDHDCPHCPPEQVHEHGSMQASEDNQAPCVDGASDCLIAEELNHDSRTGTVKFKDSPTGDIVFLATADLTARFAIPTRLSSPPRYATLHTGAPPPLHVLYCVYLD